jgi:hypothetical protein
MPNSRKNSLRKRFNKFGGDCPAVQLQDPNTICPITQEPLSTIDPEYRASINGVCYDARALCEWLSMNEHNHMNGQDPMNRRINDNDWNRFSNNYCHQLTGRIPPPPPPNNNNNQNNNNNYNQNNNNNYNHNYNHINNFQNIPGGGKRSFRKKQSKRSKLMTGGAQIEIKKSDGTTFTIDVDYDHDNFGEVKKKIEAITGMPVDTQRLILERETQTHVVLSNLLADHFKFDSRWKGKFDLKGILLSEKTPEDIEHQRKSEIMRKDFETRMRMDEERRRRYKEMDEERMRRDKEMQEARANDENLTAERKRQGTWAPGAGAVHPLPVGNIVSLPQSVQPPGNMMASMAQTSRNNFPNLQPVQPPGNMMASMAQRSRNNFPNLQSAQDPNNNNNNNNNDPNIRKGGKRSFRKKQSKRSKLMTGGMQIIIKHFDKMTFSLDVNTSDTFSVIKQKIEALTGIPKDRLRLTFRGMRTFANDEYTLANYNIQEGNTLLLLVINPRSDQPLNNTLIDPQQKDTDLIT